MRIRRQGRGGRGDRVSRPRGRGVGGAHPRVRRLTALLATVCMTAVTLVALPSAQAKESPRGGGSAAAQTLEWTAGDSITEYTSAPETAVAGAARIVFENSAATGNTQGMPHTLTFTTSDPEYNDDVDVNILANPNDANNGRYEVDVELTPGVYQYHCTIPGHGQMKGELTVTGGGGEDTTAPKVSAEVAGQKNDTGAFVGNATVTLDAEDENSGVESVEYALGEDELAPYDAPVVVDEVGDHTLRYRATDKAGNTAEEKSEKFTVVEPSDEDTEPPQVTAAVEGERDPSGDYLAMATLKIEATDADSGVGAVEYAVNGGEFASYAEPVMMHAVGDYRVVYRAEDKAGNSTPAREITFTVVEDGGPGEPEPDCPETDDRPLVVVGDVDAHVPNRQNPEGCTVNEVVEDERTWETPEDFRDHVDDVTAELVRAGTLDEADREAVRGAAEESGVGEDGRKGYEKLFDGTQDSFEEWEQVGGGGFDLNDDGTMTSSTTTEGMGMLWFPEKKYGDFSLRLQFRDDAARGANGNTGVFVRFPGVHDHPDEPRPEWVAIKYGHEMQIFDSEAGDQYKTGSVYGFDLVRRDEGLVPPKGTWNDYEIRVVDQHYEIYRSGKLINEFDNAPGQLFSPARDDDPGTDGRQLDLGHVGLQTHSTSDVVSYRDVRIRPL